MSIVVKNSLAERIYKISQELNIPRVTVERVVKAYLDDMVVSAEKGEDIIVPGVFSVRMMIDSEDNHVIPSGRVSNVLKERLKNVHIEGSSLNNEDTMNQVGEEIE